MESWTTVRIRPKCEHNEPSFGHTWRYGIAKYFRLRLEYIGWYDKTDSVFWEMKTNIYFTYFWHMAHFIMIFFCHGINRSKEIEMENSKIDSSKVNNFFSGNCMREMYTKLKKQWKMKIYERPSISYTRN